MDGIVHYLNRSMRFGAIDIGSNAARLLVKDLSVQDGKIAQQKISFIRVPLRLGEDVFEDGLVSDQKAESLVKTMKAFRYLIEAQDISWFRACATSSLREAKNGGELVDRIEKEALIRIDRISGAEEAELIFRNFQHHVPTKQEDLLYIDVGGGSTELTLIRGGKKIRSQSFQLGTVRALKGRIPDGEWDAVAQFVKHIREDKGELVAVGTGGNINRYHRLSRCGRKEAISLDTLIDWHHLIDECPLVNRMKTFELKPDRADVIVPAGDIYIRTMQLARCSEIRVPKVGLSDGMIIGLWDAFLADQHARQVSLGS